MFHKLWVLIREYNSIITVYVINVLVLNNLSYIVYIDLWRGGEGGGLAKIKKKTLRLFYYLTLGS